MPICRVYTAPYRGIRFNTTFVMQKTLRNLGQAASILILTGVATIARADAVGDVSQRGLTNTGLDWSALVLPPAQPDPQQSENFSAFTEALANEAYSEAEVTAKQMIEMAYANAASTPGEQATALHNLAVAQHLQGSYESAVQNYTAAIGAITSGENNLSPSLIMPLRGLAQVQLDLKMSSEAQETFEKALHVSHVNVGPHSLDQLPILNSKMDAYLAGSDPESALDVLDRIHMLYMRKYPKNSEELLPVYYQQAAMYDKLKMYHESHNAWRHVLIIKRKFHAKNDLALIEPHLRIAEIGMRDMQTSAFRAVTTSPAERNLKKALWIAENSPEENWEVRKDCLLSLADFYTMFAMTGRARRYYSAAWELMSADENHRAARAAELEQPVPLAQHAPYPYAHFEYSPDRDKIDPDDYEEGELLIAFTINEDGRTENHRVIEANPANYRPMENRVQNSVEEFIYRPRHVDGKATMTIDQQYRATYYYLPSEYQAFLEKSLRRGAH